MREETRESGSVRFWAHVVAVGGLHAWLLIVATGWSRGCASARGSLAGGDSGAAWRDELTWVDPSVFAAAMETPGPPTLPEPPVEPVAYEKAEVRNEVDELIESELKLPPPPKEVEKPKPAPKATPSPPKEKVKAKPTPKKEVKEVVKKAEAKSKPNSSSPSAAKKPEKAEKAKPENKKEEKPEKKDATKKAFLAAKSGTKKSTGGGVGAATGTGVGRSEGSGDDGALAHYHAHIQRRFYQRWAQPTSVFTTRTKFVTTVEITIQKGGSISSVRMVKSSGNVVVDESVMLAARSVAQIDPPPSAVPKVPYVVEIDFELN